MRQIAEFADYRSCEELSTAVTKVSDILVLHQGWSLTRELTVFYTDSLIKVMRSKSFSTAITLGMCSWTPGWQNGYHEDNLNMLGKVREEEV